MGADRLVLVGIAIVGVAAGAFAAFSIELPAWVRTALAAIGLMLLAWSVSRL